MKNARIEAIPGGTVTSPLGFHAGAAKAGIKNGVKSRLDLGILFSEERCAAAAVFTRAMVKSSPVLLDQERIKKGSVVAVIANSGCANASTGDRGYADAEEMTALAAKQIGAEPEDVLVSSTGVIGKHLPMPLIRSAVREIALSRDGGHDFAHAIMTTDTASKEVAFTATDGDSKYTIGGVTKGSGMIHPNMGTMLAYITTDAAVSPEFLNASLRKAVDVSFNMVSVDGDTSPSDTVLLMANGLVKNPPIASGTASARLFQQALDRVCVHLAREIARDGEGATRLIEVRVEGAKTRADARLAARTVTTSSLVKTAVHGADPNWGRILAAVGRSGAAIVESRTDIVIGTTCVLKGGTPQEYDEADVVRVFQQKEVPIKVLLNLGKGAATAWGCDLSKEYVTINSQYMT
jgi:glutamate N-acetyltransferase / amino-acid N-acetyltransferase